MGVLERATGQAWFDRVRVPLADLEWAMLLAVAEGKGGSRETKELERTTFAKYAAGIARNVARKANERVRVAKMEADKGGAPPGEDDGGLLAFEGRAWRLTTSVEIV